MSNSTRRLRKGQSPPSPDAAGEQPWQIVPPSTPHCLHCFRGVISGTKYHGRPTPVRGFGLPPKDDYYPEYVPTKAFVPNRSYVSVRQVEGSGGSPVVSHLASCSDLITNCGGATAASVSSPNDGGAGLVSTRERPRSGTRLLEQSFRSSLVPALAIVQEVCCCERERARECDRPTILLYNH